MVGMVSILTSEPGQDHRCGLLRILVEEACLCRCSSPCYLLPKQCNLTSRASRAFSYPIPQSPPSGFTSFPCDFVSAATRELFVKNRFDPCPNQSLIIQSLGNCLKCSCELPILPCEPDSFSCCRLVRGSRYNQLWLAGFLSSGDL